MLARFLRRGGAAAAAALGGADQLTKPQLTLLRGLTADSSAIARAAAVAAVVEVDSDSKAITAALAKAINDPDAWCEAARLPV